MTSTRRSRQKGAYHDGGSRKKNVKAGSDRMQVQVDRVAFRVYFRLITQDDRWRMDVTPENDAHSIFETSVSR